jgi:hypothetical protein
MMADAVRFDCARPAPLVHAATMTSPPSSDRARPEVGRLLEELAEAQFAGEVTTGRGARFCA